MPDPVSPKIQKLIDPESGQVVHLVYAIPPELLSGGAADDDGISIQEIGQRLWRGRLWIIATTVLGAAFGLVIALSKPNVYTAEVVALPPQEKSGGGLGQFAGLAAVAGIALPSGDSTSKDALLAILNSRTLHERLITQFDLAVYYKTPDSRDRTVKSFEMNWAVKAPKTEAAITFSYTHTDPQVAANVANQGAELLSELFTTMQQSTAARERTFLEERLKQAEGDWTKAADILANFMREHNAVQIEAQTEATVAALGTLQGQLIAQKIELNAQRAVASGEDNPLLRLLVERISGLEQEITRLQGSSAEGALIGLAALPALGQEYLGLLREIKRQEGLQTGLITQIEVARISEVRQVRALTVVDQAQVPDLESGPKRSLICIAATLLGGLIGAFLAFVSPLIRSHRRRSDPTAPENDLKGELS